MNLNANLDKEYEELSQMTKEESIFSKSTAPSFEIQMNQYMQNAETIGLTYDDTTEECCLFSKVGEIKSTIRYEMSHEKYREICTRYHVDMNSKYNSSSWYFNNYGDMVRVFAVMPPITTEPNITMNISRKPLGIIDQPDVDKLLPQIIAAGSFLVVGGTGSGKTYFLNNVLKKYYSKTNLRIGIVEEFRELFAPNENTYFLQALPAKPDRESLFPFTCAQLNLMRTDLTLCGEIKGAEAYYLINQASSGIPLISTSHGDSAIAGLERMKIMMSQAGICTDVNILGSMIAKGIRHVIFIEHHKVKNIKRLTGVYNTSNGKFQTEDVFTAD